MRGGSKKNSVFETNRKIKQKEVSQIEQSNKSDEENKDASVNAVNNTNII